MINSYCLPLSREVASRSGGRRRSAAKMRGPPPPPEEQPPELPLRIASPPYAATLWTKKSQQINIKSIKQTFLASCFGPPGSSGNLTPSKEYYLLINKNKQVFLHFQKWCFLQNSNKDTLISF